MDITISEQILRQTECDENFECLSGETKCLCKVQECLECKVLFIENLNGQHCRHWNRWGDSFASCSCPLRRELYNRYGI